MPLRSILVTGADGFVGGHLLPLLKQAFPDAALHETSFDVTDSKAVEAAIIRLRPDACVHLAAIAAIPFAGKEPERAWQVNLHGTLNLARAILAHAASCRLLFVSSADAYGGSFKSGKPVAETDLLAPLNTYAATKAAADLALGAMVHEGLNVVRLRPFNHTGPGQSDAFAVPAFARQVARIAAGLQEPVLRVGALEPRRDFLDVRDVCAAYVACLLRTGEIPAGSILNIASGELRRVGEILADLLALAGVDAAIEVEGSRLRPVDIPLASGDPRQAEALLGWKPAIPWKQTLSDVLADWRLRVA